VLGGDHPTVGSLLDGTMSPQVAIYTIGLAAVVSAEDVPALLAEVKRLRAERAARRFTEPDDDAAERPDPQGVNARYQLARLAGQDAVDAGKGWDQAKINALVRSWQDVAWLHDEVAAVRRFIDRHPELFVTKRLPGPYMRTPVHPCRLMPTRPCPASYRGVCGDRPCARFESTDETPWQPEVSMAEQEGTQP
jgi:hypothetical protein